MITRRTFLELSAVGTVLAAAPRAIAVPRAKRRSRVVVLGVGTAGIGTLASMKRNGLREFDFAAIDTAAIEPMDRLRAHLVGTDLLVIVGALGGETAEGAIPIIAATARETGAMTVALVTLPYLSEGAERIQRAVAAWRPLLASVDAVVPTPSRRRRLLPWHELP
ncbi:MAG: hypothetical protein ACREQJ_01655, partial [Candidatus Binatia bacterium]